MSREFDIVTSTNESHNTITSSISQMITPIASSISNMITSTVSSITNMVTSRLESHNSENALFPEFSEYMSTTNSVSIHTNDNKLAPPPAFNERNVATPSIKNDILKNFNVETIQNNVLI